MPLNARCAVPVAIIRLLGAQPLPEKRFLVGKRFKDLGLRVQVWD